ncbi:C1QL [Mytilus coruscus]|uniref:C1QL n=1 Tax=Mytilus coruscus TaxID=42192 RepID=A0A6J8CLC6_MYTCO|nr:C1QL [Mytilus coruscus]
MNADGFLLNPGQTSSPGITSQYISMDMYLAEKKELRNQIFQFQRENEQTLQLLTTQLQQKLSVIDDKLNDSSKPNDMIEFANLKQKNRELEVNLTFLQEKHKLLQSSYVRQKDQLEFLKNTTTEVLKELADLKQLKCVNQTLDLRVVNSKIQSLEQKTNLLTNNQNARSQDFLALYNMTRVTDNNVNEMGKQFANQVLSHERRQNATSSRNFNDLINRFHDIEANQNTTFAEVVSKIDSLEVNVNHSKKENICHSINNESGWFGDYNDIKPFPDENNKFLCLLGYDELLQKRKTVAFTAYRSGSQILQDQTKVLFDQVWTNVGNGYNTSSGIFTAPHAGLYHFAAVILSENDNVFYLGLFHNSVRLSVSWVTGAGFKTGTFDVVLSLQIGDEVYIAAFSRSAIYADSAKSLTFSGHSIS